MTDDSDAVGCGLLHNVRKDVVPTVPHTVAGKPAGSLSTGPALASLHQVYSQRGLAACRVLQQHPG
jgi:hypothetical protein